MIENIDQFRIKLVNSLKIKNMSLLIVFSLMAIVSHLFFMKSIGDIDMDGFMINQSGKQRFLSQSISFLATRFVQTVHTPEHEKIKDKFLMSIDEMWSIHQFLEDDNTAVMAKFHSKRIDSIYNSAPFYLSDRVRKFLNEAYLLLDSKDEEISTSNPHYIYLINSSAMLLSDLNLITSQYEVENLESVNDFRYSRTYYLLFSILFYIIIFVFYFDPMTKRINNNLVEISKKENEIDTINNKQISTIIDVQDRERQRIANDLHDGLIQSLTTISYKIKNEIDKVPEYGSGNNLNEISSMVDKAIGETHNIAYSIIPPMLREFGLVPTINALCEEMKSQLKIHVVLQVYELSERLEERLELNLYRITQEAINNVIKYADAKNVLIQLIRHPSSITLIIEDDGIGFDLNLMPSLKGLGLLNIEERTKAFGGTSSINSSLAQGTEIMVEIPIINT